MVMPFREDLKTIYVDYIKPAVESKQLLIKRGDDFFSHHEIMTEIWSSIYHSKVVIGDLTGKNANVFYELGIAHSLGKPVLMLAQDISDVPFDVRGKRVIIYEFTPKGLKELQKQVRDALDAML